MIHKIRAIALRQVKYSDSSIIANLYTDLYGRQSYMVHGVGSKKGKAKRSLFQPLNFLSIEAYHKDTRSVQQLKEVQLDHPFQSITDNIYKSTIALFIAEILTRTLHEEESNPELFDFITNSIQVFDLTEFNPNFHIHFLIHLTKYLGFFPNNDFLSDSWFDLKTGHFDRQKPFHNHYLDKKESRIFSDFLNYSQDQHLSLQLSSTMRLNLLEKFLDYYYLHFEGMGQVKSLDVLKDVFH